jgi:transposase
MGKIHLTDSQWAFIQPLLPPPARTGRPRADDRRTIEGIVYILVTGCRWQDLPREYGAPTAVWRRLSRWGEQGVWERASGALRLLLLISRASLSSHWPSSMVRSRPPRRAARRSVSPRRGKAPNGCSSSTATGSRWVSTSTARIPPRSASPKRPEKLVADRAYDRSALRDLLRRRGIKMCIPPKRRPARWRPKRGRPIVARKGEYRCQYKVERSFAWPGNFRRLLIR